MLHFNVGEVVERREYRHHARHGRPRDCQWLRCYCAVVRLGPA